jgi:hypothetical protein
VGSNILTLNVPSLLSVIRLWMNCGFRYARLASAAQPSQLPMSCWLMSAGSGNPSGEG